MVACFCRLSFRQFKLVFQHGRLYKWDHSRQIIGEALAATSVLRWFRWLLRLEIVPRS